MQFIMQDIVFLQEVFIKADVTMLATSAKAGKLKHAHFFHSGMLLGELLLLSAYPVHEVQHHFICAHILHVKLFNSHSLTCSCA